MRGDGNKYKVKSENYLAQLSYTLPKLYLEVGGRYRVVRLEESKTIISIVISRYDMTLVKSYRLVSRDRTFFI